NFFIPSGSGQAYVTMPIMSPLATITGVPQQVAVLAYQFGDGFTNMVVPTSALVMGTLALGKIPYTRWVRFVMPLMFKLFALAIAVLVLAVKFGDSWGFTTGGN
ncbi:MAG: TIGR00366 family protein, partial [Thermoanaerobaculia bacterium]